MEMRNLIARLAPTLGFSIKVVERTGTSIRNKFSQGSLWEGTLCGREDCTPCSQDTEKHPPCTRVSVLYENICKDCNPGAGGKGDIKIKTGDTPSIYVGESSRSLQERGKEHQGDYKARSEKSHMHKHRMVHHNGEDPQFILKAVKYFKTALSRQTAEAIRIRRRGGESGVLNSKAEYNRCFIPRLTVLDEKSVEEMEELEKEDDKRIQEEIDRNQESWEGGKSSKRAEGIRKELDKTGTSGTKRIHQEKQKPSKRRKFALMEDDWGERVAGMEDKDVEKPKIPDNPDSGAKIVGYADGGGSSKTLPATDTKDVRAGVRKTTILQYMVRSNPDKDPLSRLGQASSTARQEPHKDTSKNVEEGTIGEAGLDSDNSPEVCVMIKDDAVKMNNKIKSSGRSSGTFLTEKSPPITTPSSDCQEKLQIEELRKATLTRSSRGGVLNGPQKFKGVLPSNTPPPKKLDKVRKLGAKKKNPRSFLNTPPKNLRDIRTYYVRKTIQEEEDTTQLSVKTKIQVLPEQVTDPDPEVPDVNIIKGVCVNNYDENGDCMTLARLEGLRAPEISPESGDQIMTLGQESNAGEGCEAMGLRLRDFCSVLGPT